MSDNSILEGNNCVSLYEIENEIVWHKFNTSMSSFCCNVIKSTNQTDKLVCCIVGEGLSLLVLLRFPLTSILIYFFICI